MGYRKVEIDGKSYKISFSYDERLKDRIKAAIPGRRWDPDEKCWRAPVNPVTEKALAALGFELPEKPKPEIDFSVFEMAQLRPYQAEDARWMAQERDLVAMNGNEMGLGKTRESLCAVVSRWNVAAPCLIICPAVVKGVWEKEIRELFPDMTIEVLSGKAKKDQAYTVNADFTIINYDILASWKPLLMKKHKCVIIDECHRIKNNTAAWTKAAREIAGKIQYKLCLSGTPITSRPLDFYNVLKLVAPEVFPNKLDFCMRYCGPTPNKWTKLGYDFKGASNTAELHEKSQAFMIRRLKKDVLDDLPDKSRIVIPVDIDLKKYFRAEMAAMEYADPLPAIEMCKQAAMELKIPAIREWIGDFLDGGRKLVVFATHTATLDALEEAFPGCARIDGGTPGGKRQEIVDRFQSDPGCNLFIGNLQAAGVGLTLTAASATLTVELGWVPGDHAQAEDRVHRIGQKSDSVEAYYMVATGTIEQLIMNVLDDKMRNISEVVDGKDIDPGELMAELMEKYQHKPRARSKPRASAPRM